MKYLLIFLMILIIPLKVDDVQSLVYECSKEAYESSLYQKENEMFLNRNLFESRLHKLIKNNTCFRLIIHFHLIINIYFIY